MAVNVTFSGNPLTLVGRKIAVGQVAPDFSVVSTDLKEARLTDFTGKIKMISSFPSLDTPVCDLQVKEFNKKAAGLSADIIVIGISKDLPFAVKRFCSANEIKNEVVFSDYKTGSFGINYGLLIKELNLLSRAALIIDKAGILRYMQIAPELTKPLDYAQVLSKLDEVAKDPGNAAAGGAQVLKCKPCEGTVDALAKDKVEKLIASHRGWELVEDKKLVKEFKFKDFIEAKYFLDLISVISQEQGHHPNLSLIYNKLKVTLTTHASGGLTDNDFIMASIIDELEN